MSVPAEGWTAVTAKAQPPVAVMMNIVAVGVACENRKLTEARSWIEEAARVVGVMALVAVLAILRRRDYSNYIT